MSKPWTEFHSDHTHEGDSYRTVDHTNRATPMPLGGHAIGGLGRHLEVQFHHTWGGEHEPALHAHRDARQE